MRQHDLVRLAAPPRRAHPLRDELVITGQPVRGPRALSGCAALAVIGLGLAGVALLYQGGLALFSKALGL